MINRLILCFSLILFMTGTQQQIYSQCVTCPGNTVTGIQSSALGHGDTVSANYSFAAGRNSHIHSTTQNPSHYSNIIGSWSRIEKGGHANVIGSFSQASNNFSFVMGTWSKAKGSSSFAIGSHVEAWSEGSFIIGNGKDTTKFINTIPNSLMIGFGSVLPTLFVEKTPFSFNDDRTGRIGIGNVTNPQAKLHIRADAIEDATLMLEATGSNKTAKILMQGGQAYIGTTNKRHSLNFFTGEGNNRMTIDGESGNVGIGVSAPTSRLHVAGAVHATGNLIINNTTTITNGRIGRFANGNASAPAYSFSRNQNTGMFQPAAGILAFSTGGTEKVRISSNGNVGIGTNSPASTLHIKRRSGSSQLLVVESVTGNSGILLKSDVKNKGYFWWDNASQYLALGPGENINSIIFKYDNIGVGCTPSSSYKLDIAGAARLDGSLYVTDGNNVYVNGEIHAKKFRATYTPWPDYVFDPAYNLLQLHEVEQFIQANRHLPGMPSNTQVEKEGFELAEMNGLLLKKVEELTLYLIEQQKEIIALKEKMSQIEIQ